jgi:anti-sigma factor RsiW
MSHNPEKCKAVFEVLSQYLDFELPPEACAEVEDHLADCTPCVEFAESLRKTVDLCRKYQPATMPRPMTEAARADLQGAWQRMLEARRQGERRDAGRG